MGTRRHADKPLQRFRQDRNRSEFARRKAVLTWLETATGYLLILDNADEPAAVKDYLPNHPTGHILVTSRSKDLGDLEIAAIELEDMLPDDALEIRECVLGPDHPDTALTLNNLAYQYRAQGKLTDAEPFYRRALEIRERVLGHDHTDTASSLNNLAYLYQVQDKLTDAETLFRRALEIWEHVLGSDHPDLAMSLNNLAGLYYRQGKMEDAEPFFRRALDIWERTLGPEHPDVALVCGNLASVLVCLGRTDEAAAFLTRAAAIRKAHAERNGLPVPD